MNYKDYLKIFAIVIVFISVVIFYFFHDIQSILINLATDAIFLIIVFFGVDKLIEKNKEEEWVETVDLINDTRIQFFVNAYMASIRDWLNYSFRSFTDQEKEKLQSGDQELMREVIIEFTKNPILRDFYSRSKGDVDWKSLFEGLDGVQVLIDKFFLVYHDKISPELFPLILKVDISIFRSKNWYLTIPEFFDNSNVSENAMHIRDTVSTELKEGLVAVLKIDELIN